MLTFLYSALNSFRPVFSRHRTWLLFSMIVLGFIGATEMIGVTSFCRFWGLGESAFHAFLNFFRSEAYSLPVLIQHWITFVLNQGNSIQFHDRVVLLGDHTYVPKDGRKMPGVVTLHQNSQTQSKPSYFRGHCWGAICLAIGSLSEPFALPLALGIHQGQIHIGEENTLKTGNTLGVRIIQMALNFALNNNTPAVLVLDAFFPSARVFRCANSIWSTEIKKPFLTLIVRAKSNCVAYFKPDKKKKKKCGRPLIYGEKIKLAELFDHPDFFSKMDCMVYGKNEEVSFLVVDLLWRPIADTLRFILFVSSRGSIILMCSDLNQEPKAALELYCMRTRIETMFDMLKNLIGAFHYRFWSLMMPRHSRSPKSNQLLKQVSSKAALNKVKLCWDAYERFVMMGAISLGLLQIISIKFHETIWKYFDVYLRTRSRILPSERTVKVVIAQLLLFDLMDSAGSAIMQIIRTTFFCKKKQTRYNSRSA
jgi:hypothetical protein